MVGSLFESGSGASREGGDEGELTHGAGSEIGTERGSTDGRGQAASERKREGRDARAWALAWLARPGREENGLGGFWTSADLVITPRADGSPFFFLFYFIFQSIFK